MIPYNHFQDTYEKLKSKYHVVFVTTYEEAELHICKDCVLIVDDQFCKLESDKEFNQQICELFVRKIHHNCINVILTVHLLFSKPLRLVFLNATHFLIGKWVKDKLSLLHFGKAYGPGNSKFFLDSYNDVMKTPYKFLLCDMSMKCPDDFRIRSSCIVDSSLVIYKSEK